MITLYTAIGTYKLNRNGYPSVVSGEREYSLDTFELIMWSVLSYRISSYDELKEMFCQKVQELHITNERGFDHYLSRMLSRNLIASGKNSDGVEALYSLLSRLHIEILPNGILTRILTFFDLVFQRNIPVRTALDIFHVEKTTPSENWVLSMLKYQSLTTAELIKCNEKAVTQIHNTDELIDILYSDEHTDYESIILDSFFSEERNTILKAVANLYLKQRVNFYIAQ